MATQMHNVEPGPRPHIETVEPWFRYAADFFRTHFGRSPSRNTLGSYIRDGYPVVRCGPRVRVPVFMAVKRPMTTREAMERFLTVVRALERKHNVPAPC